MIGRLPPKLLLERAPPTGADQVWVSTSLTCTRAKGWLFLAAVMDLYSRRIVGWAMAPSLANPLGLQL